MFWDRNCDLGLYSSIDLTWLSQRKVPNGSWLVVRTIELPFSRKMARPVFISVALVYHWNNFLWLVSCCSACWCMRRYSSYSTCVLCVRVRMCVCVSVFMWVRLYVSVCACYCLNALVSEGDLGGGHWVTWGRDRKWVCSFVLSGGWMSSAQGPPPMLWRREHGIKPWTKIHQHALAQS